MQEDWLQGNVNPDRLQAPGPKLAPKLRRGDSHDDACIWQQQGMCCDATSRCANHDECIAHLKCRLLKHVRIHHVFSSSCCETLRPWQHAHDDRQDCNQVAHYSAQASGPHQSEVPRRNVAVLQHGCIILGWVWQSLITCKRHNKKRPHYREHDGGDNSHVQGGPWSRHQLTKQHHVGHKAKGKVGQVAEGRIKWKMKWIVVKINVASDSTHGPTRKQVCLWCK
mmetsp:Transcript_20042/g.36197  ORF Transcript_20042/g.36197 Transcript_20042/m.36197 type:complete len:224 (+) Transcript_20042:144-815(+)